MAKTVQMGQLLRKPGILRKKFSIYFLQMKITQDAGVLKPSEVY